VIVVEGDDATQHGGPALVEQIGMFGPRVQIFPGVGVA
jgi:hypothetical protein